MTISGGSLKQYNLHGKNSAVLQNPNIELPYNPITPLLGWILLVILPKRITYDISISYTVVLHNITIGESG